MSEWKEGEEQAAVELKWAAANLRLLRDAGIIDLSLAIEQALESEFVMNAEDLAYDPDGEDGPLYLRDHALHTLTVMRDGWEEGEDARSVAFDGADPRLIDAY